MLSTMAAKQPSRKALTLQQKVGIIEEIRKGKKQVRVAEEFGIAASSVRTILKNKENIMAAFKGDVFKAKRKRMRTSAWPELEKALVIWLREARKQRIPVSGPLLQEKADEFSLKLKLDNFTGSVGWLARFKERNCIVFKSVCGEAGAVNLAETDDWREKSLKALLNDYAPKDVFNADETGLFYRMQPNKTMAFKKESVVGGKKSKERLTVMVCSNMDGSEKLPLLVIGKFRNPRCFKGIRQLPVDYDFNKKAWITQIVFENWLRKLDRKFAMQNRKVLFFVDNCSAHGDVEGLAAIKLEFLPPNTTSVLQPMDQGIIQNLKVHYRHKLLQRMIFCMDHKLSFEMDVLKAIHYLAASWTTVSSTTIVNCFKHAGFLSPEPAENEGETMEELPDLSSALSTLREKGLEVPEGFAASTFIHGDDEVPVCEQLSDDEIIRQVTSTEICADSDEEDESAGRQQPNQLAVSSAIDTLQLLFSMHGDSAEELAFLLRVEAKALEISNKNLKQVTLDSFLEKK